MGVALIGIPLYAQPSIQIVSPRDGAIVNPGQTIKVVVKASDAITRIIIVAEGGIDRNEPVPVSASEFLLTLPPDPPAGRYLLTAVGAFRPRQPVFSIPVSIDVEPAVSPVGLIVEPGSLLNMYVGDLAGLTVVAKFPGGSTLNITHSSRVTYESTAPAIAEVSPAGVVLAKAPGSAKISINGRMWVPVTVRRGSWR